MSEISLHVANDSGVTMTAFVIANFRYHRHNLLLDSVSMLLYNELQGALAQLRS